MVKIQHNLDVAGFPSLEDAAHLSSMVYEEMDDALWLYDYYRNAYRPLTMTYEVHVAVSTDNDGNVLGWSVLSIVKNTATNRREFQLHVFVDSAFRNNGIGTELANAVIDRAVELEELNYGELIHVYTDLSDEMNNFWDSLDYPNIEYREIGENP